MIWGHFPQEHFEAEDVAYMGGEHLVEWLTELPPKLTAPQRAAYVTALQEVREAVKTRQSPP
jgi:hypothetical protein